MHRRTTIPPEEPGGLTTLRETGLTRIAFTGRLDAAAAAAHWKTALRATRGARKIVLDLGRVTELDGAGAVLVLRLAEQAPGTRIEGAEGAVAASLERNAKALAAAPIPSPEPRLPFVQGVGRTVVLGVQGLGQGIAFLGEAAFILVRGLARPWRIRPADLARHLHEVGTRAFPLTVLLGVLIGVILAFQSSIPLRRFGAEVFVPNLVGISLLRELGPLMAAVILSGRTASAYAAELGTMVVNEEVDALRIMGVDAGALLVLPRLLAGMLAMPVLALLFNLAGLVGMTGVMMSLGFPIAAVTAQLTQWISVEDLAGGLGKAAVFGLVIAGIGCRAGLGAGRGPRAVGDAATSAVVGGIVSTVVLDGLFAVLFFRLGW